MFGRVTLVAAVVAFALGLGTGWVVFTAGGPPCWEVQADLEEARDEQVESFGQADDAMRAAAARAAERPDCFSPRERESLQQMAEAPSHAPPPEYGTPGQVTVEPTGQG